MKKSELIDRVAEKSQQSRAAVARIVDAIFDTRNGAIAEAVRSGRKVSIHGFGRFGTKKRAARKGRNPRTGQSIDIAESTVISFTPGKNLREALSTQDDP